jgi:hypothetical protein
MMSERHFLDKLSDGSSTGTSRHLSGKPTYQELTRSTATRIRFIRRRRHELPEK